MGVKKIIREEVDDFEWIRDSEPEPHLALKDIHDGMAVIHVSHAYLSPESRTPGRVEGDIVERPTNSGNYYVGVVWPGSPKRELYRISDIRKADEPQHWIW
jgi:hypothetical protein